ncbi:MAG: hypothetical protein ACREJC_12995, partial [Tepidisphaeraceae bacterium]
TGQANLLAELEAAYRAVKAAVDALRQVTVNGRDYYVQGPDAYRQARHEMDERVAMLESVRGDVLALHQAVDSQGPR